MVTERERQEIVDSEHLRLLPVFYWVLAAMDIFFALYGLIYVAMGVFMAMIPWDEASAASEPPPAFMGWFFAAIGLGFMLSFGGIGLLKILVGFWIRGRKHRTAILVVAGLTCLSWPFGIVVGVFTFIVMLRPSVAELFGAPGQAAVVSAEPTSG